MSGLLLLRRPSQVRCLSSRLSQVRHYALIGKPQSNAEPRWTLPKTPARTRFAPSPTGYLHLGSLRTALYNYLLAQATGGQFILRLEDTDQSRLVSDAEQVLYDDLRWAGLHWDEGPDKGGPFGPYRQSERLGLYKQHANALLKSGHAFRCFCTREDLEFNVAQATAHGGAAHYPGTCTHVELGESDRRAANGEPHVIRFKAAETPVAALDLVYGSYKKAEREDSFIIMKSDGFPTYHFANVVDDHFMEITHVIRGAEWLISTPKHVELYNAFGWQPPNFAHVGLLVDAQRQKLSKRDMANIGIGVYRSNKILPEALLNFSALLGWDPNLQQNTHLNRRGIMSLEEMKKNFTLKFTRGDIVVDGAKLKFFQSQITRGLISGEHGDRATLDKRIILPILTELQKLDERLRDFRENGTVDSDPGLQALIESIAPRPEDPKLTEDYVLQALRARKGSVDDPAYFLYNNILAFYRPSKKAMREKYLELQVPIRKVMLLKDDRTKLLNTDISKVLRQFTHKLKKLPPSDWDSDEKLGDVVKQLTDSVKYYDTNADKDKFESAGWKFLRHALLNGASGLSIIPVMRMLGQDETVYRIQYARKMATAEEDKAMKGAERAKSAVRILPSGKNPFGKDTKNSAASRTRRLVIEPRNVMVHEPKSKKAPTPPGTGPFSIYLNKEQVGSQDGPFKTRGPTPSPRSAPREPIEVERAFRPLKYLEFRQGTRRILDTDTTKADPELDELSAKERAERRDFQDMRARENARVRAEKENRTNAWIEPRSTISREGQRPGPPEGRGAFLAGDPIAVDIREHVKHIAQVNKEAARLSAIRNEKAVLSAKRRAQMSTEQPMGQMGIAREVKNQTVNWSLEVATRDSQSRRPSEGAQAGESQSANSRSQMNDNTQGAPAHDSSVAVEHESSNTQGTVGGKLPVGSPSNAKDITPQQKTIDFREARLAARKIRRERNKMFQQDGPFKAAGETPIDKLQLPNHIKHLRALNRSLASRKAAKSRRDDVRTYDKLISSGSLSPLVQGLGVKALSRGAFERTAVMPDLTHGGAADEDVVPFRNSSRPDYHEKREVAVERRVANEARNKEKAELARVEKELAQQWAERNS